ncbi:MAG: hypothetical protein LH650_06140 [Chloroflexi bacterium]|nr:hypothetical protein [Chloroflexota bacterium]
MAVRDSVQRRLGGGRTGLAAALADHRRYETAIDRLHQRHIGDSSRHALTQEGVSLSGMVLHRGSVARLLARSVASGEYRIGPATLREIRVSGKRRVVFAYAPFDLVVHAVVAGILSEVLEPTLSDRLYSYRSGLAWADAVADFARYVRQHRRQRPDPRTRGLYVLRRDVDAYTDSIPLDAVSPLWPMLRQLAEHVAGRGDDIRSEDWDLLVAVTRPGLLGDDGGLATRLRGVPTGQPIATVAFNLYLRDIDEVLVGDRAAFYGRYSDDLLFAHPHAAVARSVSAWLDDQLAERRLRFGGKKRRDLYLTGAGRASVEWLDARGTTSVPFLGMRVDMEGRVAIGDAKARALLREAQRRARNVARSLEDAALDVRGRAVVRSLTQLLDVEDHQLQGAAVPLLGRVVTDRTQLRSLDLSLARIVATAVTGDPGPAAFRQVPYRVIRAEWGLPSLHRARDRSSARRDTA